MTDSSAKIDEKMSQLNVNAAEFVPSWIKSKAEQPMTDSVGVGGGGVGGGSTPSTPADDLTSGSCSSDRPIGGDTVDDWQQAIDDDSSDAVTPNDVEDKSGALDGDSDRRPVHAPPVDDECDPAAEDDEVNDDNADGEDDAVSESRRARKKKVRKPSEHASAKEHVNIVFIGHVDAGKSTIGGQIMFLTGMVDKRTLEKYEKEAKDKNRESWYLSWALDTNLEEREKGKTVEVGRAFFETEKKHFTILDAPGHKSFVPNMIGGASQADLAVLVISARKGEFETGFDRGGQTREHAMLVKTAGVRHLVVLVNKMDDPTVQWCEQRYTECRDKLLPYLKKCGFNPKTDVTVLPCSGLTGAGLLDPVSSDLCSWYSGPAFIPLIDGLASFERNIDGPFLLPIVDKYSDRGTIALGKVESGSCRKGQTLVIMPNKMTVQVDMLWSDDAEVSLVVSGENIKLRLKGVEEGDISAGFVLCDPLQPVPTGRVFDAQVAILEHRSIICAGYNAICHLHTVVEEVCVKALLGLVDKRTGERSRTRPRFVKQDQVVIMRLECSGAICLDTFKNFPQLGRFTLRDEGKTIAIGKVLKVID